MNLEIHIFIYESKASPKGFIQVPSALQYNRIGAKLGFFFQAVIKAFDSISRIDRLRAQPSPPMLRSNASMIRSASSAW